MTIQIKKEILEKILNPFEKGFYEDFIIDQEKIKKYINEVDFVPVEEADLEEKTLKKIAFLIKNETKEKIIIKNLMTSNKKISADFFTGKEKYVAQIIKKIDTISLEVINADQKSMKILNIDENNLTTEYSSHKDSILLNWKINPISIEKTWLNPEFVLAKMKTNKKENIVSMIPEKLWENEEFQLEAIKTLINNSKLLVLLPPTIWNSNKIIEAITEDKDFFKKHWINLIFPLYRFYKTTDISIGYDVDSEESIQLIKSNIKNFVLILDEKFKDKKWVLERESIINKFYHYLSLDLKLEKTIIMKAFELEKIENLDSYIEPILSSIPFEYFNDKNNLIEMWNFIQENKIIWSRNQFKSMVEKLNNKKLLQEILPHLNKGNLIERLWESECFKLKTDKELAKEFLKLQPRLYSSLPKKLKEDDEFKIITLLGNVNKDIKYDFVFNLTDKKIIQELIKLYPTQILNHKNCPLSWRVDKNNITLVDSRLYDIYLTIEELEKITEGKEKEYFKLLKQDFNLYNHLPTKMKEIQYFTEFFVEKSIENGHCDYNKIPQSVWGNREFCINTLRKNYDTDILYFIPSIFWKEKEFILEYCKILDEEDVRSRNDLRLCMPKEINKLLEAFDIEENYTQFMLNYILETELSDNKINVRKNKL